LLRTPPRTYEPETCPFPLPVWPNPPLCGARDTLKQTSKGGSTLPPTSISFRVPLKSISLPFIPPRLFPSHHPAQAPLPERILHPIFDSSPYDLSGIGPKHYFSYGAHLLQTLRSSGRDLPSCGTAGGPPHTCGTTPSKLRRATTTLGHRFLSPHVNKMSFFVPPPKGESIHFSYTPIILLSAGEGAFQAHGPRPTLFRGIHIYADAHPLRHTREMRLPVRPTTIHTNIVTALIWCSHTTPP